MDTKLVTQTARRRLASMKGNAPWLLSCSKPPIDIR